MNIQDALDLSLNEEAFRIIGNWDGGEERGFAGCGLLRTRA